MTTRPLSFRVTAGDHASPVILHVPHSAVAIPADARSSIVLSDKDLAVELAHMTDAHTDAIASGAAAGAPIRPWLFVNALSRLVVDPERLPDDQEEMAAVGMGAVYTGTSHGGKLRDLDPARDQALVAAYFEPYAEALAGLVDDRISSLGHAVIVDVHSYPLAALPYELHGDARRPAVCLGVDDSHTPAELVEHAAAAFAAVGDVAVNVPFAGTYVPLRHYRRDPRVSSLMVEIRRDTYMDEPGGEPTNGLGRVTSALGELVRRVSRLRKVSVPAGSIGHGPRNSGGLSEC